MSAEAQQWVENQSEGEDLFERGPQFAGPEILTDRDAYVLTPETRRLIARIPGQPIPEAAVRTFDQSIAMAVADAFAPQTVIVAKESAFYDQMGQALYEAVLEGNRIGAEVVNVDRFVSSPRAVAGIDYSVISIGRMITDTGEPLVPRPGEPTLAEQIARTQDAMNRKGRNSIIIIDDGFSSPESLDPYVDIARTQGWDIVGFIAGVCPVDSGEWAETKELAEKISGNPVKYVIPVKDILDWTCQRDFTLFGGKMVEGDEYPLAAPYFLPFTTGTSGSIPPEKINEFSRQVLAANVDLVRALNDVRSEPLIFTDILAAGYGLPTSLLGQMRTPSPEENVLAYIQEAQQKI